MKHLISATLSLEAGQVWEQWPKGQRSRMLSELLRLVDFLNHGPPLDGVNTRMIARIIWEMNEDLDGSIHHDPVPTLDPPS